MSSTSSNNDIINRYREETVYLADRPSDAPRLIQAFNHPLVPTRDGRMQRVFVWFMDTSYDGMMENYNKEKTLSIPYKESDEELDFQGFYELVPGDYVFAACTRINKDARRPELDVIRIWCTGEDDITAEQKDALDKAQEAILGPRELRSLNKTEYDKKTDTYIGGVEVEQSPRNMDQHRSHTFGPTLQKQNCIIGPPSSAKLATANTELDVNLISRRNLLKAATDISSSTLLMGPPDTVAILEKQSDVVNTLKIGSHKTKSFTTLQLNLAGAENKVVALEQLGRAGVVHYDRHDHMGAFTDALSCSDIPDDFHPGYMFVLGPMIYVKLSKYRGLKFSGLQLHGGTPPIVAGAHKKLAGWETRMVNVSYRTTVAAEGQARYPLCAASNNKGPIFTTPEMRFPEKYSDAQGRISSATFARDGISLTDDKALMEFYTRELYCFNQYMLRGLPDRLKVQIDSDAFMKAISFMDEETRRTPPPWMYPPGWRPFNASRDPNQTGEEVPELEDQIPYRQRASQDNMNHDTMLGRFIPYTVAHHKVTAMTDEDIQALIQERASVDCLDYMINYSYANRLKEDPSISDTVRGRKDTSISQLGKAASGSRKQHDKRQPNFSPLSSDEEYNEPSKTFDELVDTNGNSQSVKDYAMKKARDAASRTRAKAKRQTTGVDKRKAPPSKLIRGQGLGNKRKWDMLQMEVEQTPSPSPLLDSDEEITRPSARHSDGEESRGLGFDMIQAETRSCMDIAISKSKTKERNTRDHKSYDDEDEDNIGADSEFEVEEIIASRPVKRMPRQNQVYVSLPPLHMNASANTLSTNWQDFRVLNKLTLTNIVSDNRRLEQVITNANELDDNRSVLSLHEVNQQVNLVTSCLSHKPEDALKHVSVLAGNLFQLISVEALATIHAKLCRMSIMLSYMTINNWLDKTLNDCRDLYASRMEDCADSDRWIFNLTSKVKRMVDYRNEEETLYPGDFNVTGIPEERGAVVPNQSGYMQCREDTLQHTMNILEHVLCEWTGVNRREERWKMLMMRILTTQFGRHILALDETWSIFVEATQYSIIRSRSSQPTLEQYEPFSTALSTHNLSNPTSTESRTTQAISILLSQWSLGNQSSSSYSLHDICESIQRKRAYAFSQYIRQAIGIVYYEIATENQTNLQKHILEDENKRSPFRECTSNRMRTKGLDGPFYGDRIRTKAGLFSAVIWRGITLHTKFEEERKMVFRDYSDWMDEIEGLDESYICNTQAHGTPTRRNSKWAETYWETIQRLKWEEYTKADNQPTFADTYDLLYNKYDGKRLFPHLGPIGALHLAADIAYAKVYDQVTPEEIGKYMLNISSGSSRGASVLLARNDEEIKNTSIQEKGKGKEKAKPKSITTADCEQGIRKAMILINEVLLDDENIDVGPIDPILAEHALCKFQSAWYQGLLNDMIPPN